MTENLYHVWHKLKNAVARRYYELKTNSHALYTYKINKYVYST